ncbi:glycosyltransferase family 2 protein [Thiocystis violacea]|uniref:glycosyltransferase family 2 protein n=1 Tax=Thiocystis violacea TaxID=13725 RepID=UPI001906F128|nr:glycosyltransferase [Thiocystis violacea]MBK1724892.1 glycosyl transferase [Thiocystis violacea]
MNLSDVTLVLATRDEAHNIRRFLSSVPTELALVVVDASRDETPELIGRLRPERTLVLREPGNVTRARQRGTEVARSPWLLFSDADVEFAADYFARLTALDETAVYYGPKLSRNRFRTYYKAFAMGQALCQACGVPAASGSNLLVPRKALSAVGGFDLNLSCNEDSDLVWRIRRAGIPARYRPDLVVYATDHRRIEAGRVRKTLHSILRCLFLYSGLMPQRWRRLDWGYWQDRRP